MENVNTKKKITISDIAEALGISKTTVSRAISGKGRIGEETRQRVLQYIKEMDYMPSPMAKGLAQSRTFNLCWAMPSDSTVTVAPFFVRCVYGIAVEAAPKDYDILTVLLRGDDISQLKRVVRKRKVDGVILGRTLIQDPSIEFLKEMEIPFVAIGSTKDDAVVQIDNDHFGACAELTAALIDHGIRRMALIGSSMNHVVNRIRKNGFEKEIIRNNVNRDDVFFYMDREEAQEIRSAVDDALNNQVDCLVCADDRICFEVLLKLRDEGLKIPSDIKVASFYGSEVIENHYPPITALEYDPKYLGSLACQTILKMIEGEEVPEKQLLGYHLKITDSI